MSQLKAPRALVTGCSSGIGQALVSALLDTGYEVIATVRRDEDKATLERLGATVVLLDVTDKDGIDALIASLGDSAASKARGLDLLINNAGFGAMGPVLDFEAKALRDQFETNVFAPILLAKACLPLLRTARGVVVNIGSVAGEVSSPYGGVYCASKAALHRLNDAMRMELAPLGVDVILVRPGAIESRFGKRARSELAARQSSHSAWQVYKKGIDRRAASSELLSSTPASTLAARLIKALKKRRRPALIRVGNGGVLLPLMVAVPARLRDWLFRRYFGLR
ncbi:SDR family NAD(P)-dependent oxidoreductase [Larsenimonas suaedae]|uniref:SDR family NAD(P)-dependent oxidoreductase n=1 Tax=Larsenimonas suaedae TaxID=1851019 RepID=A0ABU1GWT3_9GAMM|nr:SDR family NAD(P)-dependent oxidoreductase [Larsenimonas suaedae]MCM2973072.1 SDR family NAD(P)-dependent oxidoreductase [Larsenimonas suaedae]MDR5896509.1 SDR family NAD(P)-dependent oxidoreductase [Larsenimonas suaedae]